MIKMRQQIALDDNKNHVFYIKPRSDEYYTSIDEDWRYRSNLFRRVQAEDFAVGVSYQLVTNDQGSLTTESSNPKGYNPNYEEWNLNNDL